MPTDDDKDLLDTASSAVTDLDAQEQTASADANSSDATGEKAEIDALSIVRDVVNAKNEDAAAASPAEGEEVGQQADDADTGAAKDADDENYSDVPFNKHPRFQQLLRQSKAFKVDAERYQNVQNFIDSHGLSAEEAADGLVIFGLMKTNPAEAWKRAKPTIQKLLIAAGEVLPEDLQARVQKGEMSSEAAMEVSRSRATVQSVQATRSFEEQRAQQQQTQQAVQALSGAAEDWQADRQRKDPNFAAKMEPLMKEILFLQSREGKPNTPQGVTDQLNRAYKALVPPAPRLATPAPKVAVRPIPVGQVAGNQRAEPSSVLDIVRANRRAQ